MSSEHGLSGLDYLMAFVDSITPDPWLIGQPDDLPEPPEMQFRHFRQISVTPNGRRPAADGTMEEARRQMRAAIDAYLGEQAPERALLLSMPPGTGKTTLGVETAERLAEAGQRVLYAGPRHDFFPEVLRLARRPELWLEWQPRQAGADDGGRTETCRWAAEVNEWLARGYRGIDFCASVCGWNTVGGGCPYHAQRSARQPIVFGQHAHIALPHPLTFDAVIVDESPINAFLNPWTIPGRYVSPSGLDPTLALTPLLHWLASLAVEGVELEGPALLEVLGGAAQVAEACREFLDCPEALPRPPRLWWPQDVARADYAHLPVLAGLLLREAQAALEDNDTDSPYPARVLMRDGELTLLLRRPGNPALPAHMIALDATANPQLYEAVLRRPVEVVRARPALRGRIFQVHSRVNGRSSLLPRCGPGGPTAPYAPAGPASPATPSPSDAQLRTQIAAIVARYAPPAAAVSAAGVPAGSAGEIPGVPGPLANLHGGACLPTGEVAGGPGPAMDLPIETSLPVGSALGGPGPATGGCALITFQGLGERLAAEGLAGGMHFYAARGSNRLEGCEVLIVAGTPQPPPEMVVRTAAMVFHERMRPFDTTWRVEERPYAFADAGGRGRSYPTGGFWDDPDLQTVLWSQREAEVIQAAHRVRPALYPADVWLLTNLPVDELPPAELLSIHDLLSAPADVRCFKWHATVPRAGLLADQQGYVTYQDLMRISGVCINTARKYLKKLVAGGKWKWMVPPHNGPGRPPKAAHPCAGGLPVAEDSPQVPEDCADASESPVSDTPAQAMEPGQNNEYPTLTLLTIVKGKWRVFQLSENAAPGQCPSSAVGACTRGPPRALTPAAPPAASACSPCSSRSSPRSRPVGRCDLRSG